MLQDKNIELREVRPAETDEVAEIEQICFEPNEACTPKAMRERALAAPELFLVAYDKENGKIAGSLNGLATNEEWFRDAYFKDAGLCQPDGANIFLLGLAVLPEYRGLGIARELMALYVERERAKGRKMLVLTCVREKVKMYEKMGFRDMGISGSTFGGVQWHEMRYLFV